MDRSAPNSELDDVVRRFRAHAGLRSKAALGLVHEVLGPSDWLRGPGDDAAVVAGDGSDVLVAGEAMWPPLVQTDPFGAGVAAVVANVNDVAAMGGRTCALVDTVIGPEPVARSALEGLRFAADLYGVPVVGGHLTVRDGPPAVSAFVVGRARAVLSSRRAAPGQRLLLACCLEGRMRPDFPFFTSVRERGSRLAGDVEFLPLVAEAADCVAAKDVSMAGLLGSIAMLLEPTRSGATVDLERLPRPTGVSVAEWTAAFPTFGFLLCVPTDRIAACQGAFADRGLACEEIGLVEAGGELRVRLAGAEAVLLDLSRQRVTGLSG